MEQVLHLGLQEIQLLELLSTNWFGGQVLQHDDPHLKNPAAQLTQVAQLITQPSHSGLHCLHTPSSPIKPNGHGETHLPL